MSHDGDRPGPLQRWLSSWPLSLLLLAVVAYGSGEMVHGQLLKLGEKLWPEYHTLRADPEPPTCDPASFVAPAAGAEEEDLFEGILDEEDEAPAVAEKPAPTPKPEVAGDDDEEDADALLDDLLGEEDSGGEATLLAFAAAKKKCEARHVAFKVTSARLTPRVKQFRAAEGFIAEGVSFAVDHLRQILALILMLCALTATALRAHISLRPARCATEDRVGEGAQLAVNLMLAWSWWSFRDVELASGVAIEHPELHFIWMGGFLGMAAFNLLHLLRPVSCPVGAEGKLHKAPLAIPLYAIMGLISGLYFLIVEGHAAGLAIYLTKLTEHSILYLHVGLYVWVGMLLKQTRLASLAFDLARPWKLPPELLAFVAVVAAALPTAYSGASGIFVIAVGAVIYEELRRAGARRQLALAATAMSGSLGVVLNPCLLVVIVASLNKQVTTDQLYGWGVKVFLLTAVLFLAASLLNRQGPIKIESPKIAIPGMIKAFKPIIPYLLLAGFVGLGYRLLLEAHLDEHSAPVILPVLLLVLLVYDRFMARRAARAANEPELPVGVVGTMERATAETTGHIGALLMLMGLSMCLGGVVERADLMSIVPESFGSVWLTMGVLVVVLVVVGMTMDPYGAVILVSATVAAVAYRNGIDPVHFWMVVLVAFELGYLTPPVALNHLLTRQVIGDDEVRLADAEGTTWWSRNERVMLPVSVMSVALLIVAFGPLAWGY